MFKLSVKFNKKNEKLERSIVECKTFIDFLENSNKFFWEELTYIINRS